MIIQGQDEALPKSSLPAAPVAPRWFATLGLVAGLGAMIASSCCVIPLGLVALGAGAGVLGGLELVAAWRTPLLAISALAIVAGWVAWWWKRPTSCNPGEGCAIPARPRATLVMLLSASAIVVLAASWSYIDPILLGFLRRR